MNTGNYVFVGAGGGRGGSDGSGKPGGQDGWTPISTAPKDGTVIEVRCTFGVAPWYGLYFWKKEIFFNNAGRHEGRWCKSGDENRGFDPDDRFFSWRNTNQTSTQYVDPTGGAQNTEEYWRRACGFRWTR